MNEIYSETGDDTVGYVNLRAIGERRVPGLRTREGRRTVTPGLSLHRPMHRQQHDIDPAACARRLLSVHRYTTSSLIYPASVDAMTSSERR
jgi:hypothetical protein